MKRHILKLPTRTVEIRVTELPAFILVESFIEPRGALDAQTRAWLRPILDKYDDDPRVVYMKSPDGRMAIAR